MGFLGQGNTNTNTNETSPLLSSSVVTPPSNAHGEDAVSVSGGSQQNQYYFLNNNLAGTTPSVRDDDGGEVVEEIPQGSTTDEFAPKQLMPIPAATPRAKQAAGQLESATTPKHRTASSSFWSSLFGKKNKPRQQQQQVVASGGDGDVVGGIGTLVKPRKAPIKIEPKVFFANERTFLAWMHLSVMLAGASIAILAFADERTNAVSQLYGVLLLPVAIAFILYSMYQYARRAYMLRTRHPGPYEDTIGPAFLGIMLMVSIVAQFALKLYSMAGYQ